LLAALTKAAMLMILFLLADMPKFFNLGPTRKSSYGPGLPQRANLPQLPFLNESVAGHKRPILQMMLLWTRKVRGHREFFKFETITETLCWFPF